jgi:hypothetical protein
MTLVELAIVIGLVGILAAVAIPARSVFDDWSLSRSARLVERQMSGARLVAVAHRRKLGIRATGSRFLETVDRGGRIEARLDLGAGALRSLDSIRVRPATIRYNPRGHGSAGSVYLYRGHRGIRLISNFVGRTRRHSFRF